MSAGRELVSVATRGRFRDLMTGSTLSQIGRAFQDEGFAPDPNCSYEDTSERPTLTQEYMNAVDWTRPEPRRPRAPSTRTAD